MSLSFANLFRGFVLLALAAHAFYMYSTARSLNETFGFNAATTAIALLFSLGMMVPLVWAVTLPELPEIYTRHFRARRWFRHHRCIVCGYSVRGLGEHCPECGAAIEPPPAYRISRHTIALFVNINVAAWLIGAAVGEAWAQLDEHEFQREVEAAIIRPNPAQSHDRPAAWPASGMLWWSAETGFQRTRGSDFSFSAARN